jgi:hypothetical protein
LSLAASGTAACGRREPVRGTIPANRLLIFSPADGWQPLCRFPDLPVLAIDFPRSKAREEFRALLAGEPAAA